MSKDIKAGDYVRVVIEGKVHDAEGDFLYVGPKGESEVYKPDALVEKIDPPKPPLPTENGVYVPAHNNLTGGPNVFVLYDGEWRSTPDYDAPTAEDWARIIHRDYGLVPLVKAK